MGGQKVVYSQIGGTTSPNYIPLERQSSGDDRPSMGGSSSGGSEFVNFGGMVTSNPNGEMNNTDTTPGGEEMTSEVGATSCQMRPGFPPELFIWLVVLGGGIRISRRIREHG